jgi:subtilisin family serine protease
MTLRVASAGFAFALLFALAIMTPSGQAKVGAATQDPKSFIIPGSIIVEFSSSVTIDRVDRSFGSVSMGVSSVDQLLTRYQAADARKVFPWREATAKASIDDARLARMYEITLPDNANLDEVRAALLQNPNIEDVHFNWAMPVTVTPDDPDFTSQWHRTKLQLETAWNTERGSDSIKIAIIDTGVNYNHGDLRNNIWVNPGEDLDGDGEVYDADDLNGVDNDGNGVIDDLIGYDFFSGLGGGVWPGEDGGSPDTDPNDFDGHGSHCSGIAAAVSNNTFDVCGVAGGWANDHRSYRGPRIMCLRVGATGADGNGYVNSVNVATAIDYARNNGAHIISMSFGGSSTQNTAIAASITAGLTLLHAAGNDDVQTGDALDAFGTAVLSVASTTTTDAKSSFSNYGSWVDISSPGSSILSTYSDQYTPTTAILSGTSMAAPMVAGVAALVRSKMPSLSKSEVDSVLMATADNIDAQNPSYIGLLGSGRVNAAAALAGLAHAAFTSDITDGQVPLTVNFTDLSSNSPSTWDWTFGDGGNSTDQNPQHTYTTPGVYDVSLIVQEPNGQGDEHLKRYVWAQADSLWFGDIEADPGTTIIVPVYLANTALVKNIMVTFSVANPNNIALTGYNVTGTRTASFHSSSIPGFDSGNKRYSIFLQSSNSGESQYLQPGSGSILNLQFNVPAGVPTGTSIQVDTTSFSIFTTNVETVLGDYVPAEVVNGSISVSGCCSGPTGDVNMDTATNLTDLTLMVNELFVTFIPVACPAEANTSGDVNCDLTLTDLTRLVNLLFVSFDPVADCSEFSESACD